MHFTQIFTIALLAAGQVSSAAVPASRDVLIERANPSPQAVICGRTYSHSLKRMFMWLISIPASNNQQKYTKDAVKKAYDKGKKYWKDDDYSKPTLCTSACSTAHADMRQNSRPLLQQQLLPKGVQGQRRKCPFKAAQRVRPQRQREHARRVANHGKRRYLGGQSEPRHRPHHYVCS